MTTATRSTCKMNMKRTNRTCHVANILKVLLDHEIQKILYAEIINFNTMTCKLWFNMSSSLENTILGVNAPEHVHLNAALASKLINKYQKYWNTIRNKSLLN